VGDRDSAVVLDLGAGTGDLARALRAAGAVSVVAGDFSRPMLVAGQRKMSSDTATGLRWAQVDALSLPFADNTFDAVTSGFLLRNLVDLPQGLAEMVRVIKPGGAVVALDITHPPPGLAGAALRFGFRRVVSPIAGALSGDRSAYRYLPNSLIGFPTASKMSELFERVGAEQVTVRRLGGGSVALHVGRKPLGSE
jgi:demethylmenaquinone methyltransferase/2-methoxy-6-polyprenyl-1,4-benzoquinol methylase